MDLSNFKTLLDTVKTQQPEKFKESPFRKTVFKQEKELNVEIRDSDYTRTNEFNQLDVPIYNNRVSVEPPLKYDTFVESGELRERKPCNFINFTRPFSVFREVKGNEPYKSIDSYAIRSISSRLRD